MIPANLSSLSADQVKHLWDQQEAYIRSLEQRVDRLQGEREDGTKLKESNDRLKEQLLQATRRENILILRLTSKDKALMDLKVRII